MLVPLWPQAQTDPGTYTQPQTKNSHGVASEITNLVPRPAIFAFCDLKS